MGVVFIDRLAIGANAQVFAAAVEHAQAITTRATSTTTEENS